MVPCDGIGQGGEMSRRALRKCATVSGLLQAPEAR